MSQTYSVTFRGTEGDSAAVSYVDKFNRKRVSVRQILEGLMLDTLDLGIVVEPGPTQGSYRLVSAVGLDADFEYCWYLFVNGVQITMDEIPDSNWCVASTDLIEWVYMLRGARRSSSRASQQMRAITPVMVTVAPEIQTIFRLLDTNKDGVISGEELQRTLHVLGLGQVPTDLIKQMIDVAKQGRPGSSEPDSQFVDVDDFARVWTDPPTANPLRS